MFRKNITLLSICLLILGGLTNCGQNNKSADQKADHATSDSVQTLTDNGAWCWFSDPRAIYYSDNQIITGWVKNDGSVEIASLNLETQQKEFQNIYPQMEIDDHDNPAFTVLPDGNVFTMFAWHSLKKGIIYNQTTEGADINTFGKNVVYMP
uniref:BNR-4 repeat-containing protein n=1 Tax=Mariniphaga sediminis TaxID=1628158 RepID=UPI003565C649